MLITIHKEILNNALDNFNFNYINKLDSISTKKFDKSNLIKGLIYPDLACGKKTIIEENGKLSIEPYYELCNKIMLAYIKFPNKFFNTRLYQNHRGRWSIGHSMTNSTHYTMEQILKKILKRITLLYYLSLKNESLIPLGMLLHTVQDSFSYAHTERHLYNTKILKINQKNIDNNKNKFLRKLYEKNTRRDIINIYNKNINNKKEKLDEDLNNFIYDTVSKNKIEKSDIDIKNVMQIAYDIIYEYINISQIKSKILLPYFDKNFEIDTLDKLFKKQIKKDAQQKYITNFGYVNNKDIPFLTHIFYDNKKSLIKLGVWENVISITNDILDLYIEDLTKYTNNKTDKTLNKIIKKRVNYFHKNIFFVRPDVMKDNSGKKLCLKMPSKIDILLEKYTKNNIGFKTCFD